jgi:hypothetical protein
MWSVRFSVSGAALYSMMTMAPETLLSLWNMVTPEARDTLPSEVRYVVLAMFVLSVIARFIKQDKVK